MINKICNETSSLSFKENQLILNELASISYKEIPKNCYTNIENYLSNMLSINNATNVKSIEKEDLIPKLDKLLRYLREN